MKLFKLRVSESTGTPLCIHTYRRQAGGTELAPIPPTCPLATCFVPITSYRVFIKPNAALGYG
ncbi:hypothetical protein PHLCEN_2v5575 [Hermanssonia centrifuga]|uniref:Uncharacterized protein n=1 Tax=Hermanssonia centrifuga TaxID=98765 RepID=A0A2R6P211_9APHY|nr:hypothetical protein PHLCEN_2v5575 [Hermanssonia centrifuga]